MAAMTETCMDISNYFSVWKGVYNTTYVPKLKLLDESNAHPHYQQYWHYLEF